jgi:hypothetical protein
VDVVEELDNQADPIFRYYWVFFSSRPSNSLSHCYPTRLVGCWSYHRSFRRPGHCQQIGKEKLMSFKDLLTVLTTYPKPTPVSAVDEAVDPASELGAKISAIACEVKIKAPGSPLGSYLLDIPAIVAAENKKSATNAQQLLAAFQDVAEKRGVFQERISEECLTSEVPEVLIEYCRLRDLAIVPVPEGNFFDQWYAESVIFGSGRPTVVLPHTRKRAASLALGTVIVAWDFSRPATRAVADAMPIFEESETRHGHCLCCGPRHPCWGLHCFRGSCAHPQVQTKAWLARIRVDCRSLRLLPGGFRLRRPSAGLLLLVRRTPRSARDPYSSPRGCSLLLACCQLARGMCGLFGRDYASVLAVKIDSRRACDTAGANILPGVAVFAQSLLYLSLTEAKPFNDVVMNADFKRPHRGKRRREPLSNASHWLGTP